MRLNHCGRNYPSSMMSSPTGGRPSSPLGSAVRSVPVTPPRARSARSRRETAPVSTSARTVRIPFAPPESVLALVFSSHLHTIRPPGVFQRFLRRLTTDQNYVESRGFESRSSACWSDKFSTLSNNVFTLSSHSEWACSIASANPSTVLASNNRRSSISTPNT